MKCIYCNKDFSNRRSKYKFYCSSSCYMYQWRKNNPNYEKTQRAKDLKKIRRNKFNKKCPLKKLAYNHDYKKKGKKCEKCGSKKYLEFHHTNYRKKSGFTLCRTCHYKLHGR